MAEPFSQLNGFFSTAEEVRVCVGGQFVLSRLGASEKEKSNEATCTCSAKTRIIVDSNPSRVNEASPRTHNPTASRY